ncbi:EAL domain-containing protein [Bdellovibrio bacteriovorus]|uniref:EAL domain-containing protein n=1 Tax=Bdellovibrio reynosensis TaxID=2835041 RepID=A0ABY4CAV1_9BACT|nr:EAL domain-containing protein [Bdellovibrio reynosensis]UOF02040.1 EAL domain-containing protein [Bdellovibrio reynosensis]
MNSPAQSVDIHKDQIIFSEGDAGDCAYIIEKGRVLVYISKDKEEIPLTILGEGEIFGEMSLIDNQNRSASVRALEDVRLAIVTKQQVLERVSTADKVVQLLMRVLLKRLRRKNLNTPAGTKMSEVEFENSGAGDDGTQGALDQIKLENQIFQAFQNKEFELFYQPIVNLKTKQVMGCEALLRWNSPVHGLISPNLFIDVIENSSMVIPIGHWIINQALKDLKTIQDQLRDAKKTKLADDFMMSINISGRQFTHSDFVNNLEDLREKHDLQTKNIKLEMTERVMMDGAIALESLNQCRNQGYAISIDDFGTGFSSLQYLTQMPISFLKIDRSFVMKVLSDPKSKAVVSSIIHLAHAMDLEIIAEGIENNEESLVLETLGARYGQGYLFSKPVDLGRFLKLI